MTAPAHPASDLPTWEEARHELARLLVRADATGTLPKHWYYLVLDQAFSNGPLAQWKAVLPVVPGAKEVSDVQWPASTSRLQPVAPGGVGAPAVMQDNDGSIEAVKRPGWKLHRCPDNVQCRADIGGGCARGWCAQFRVKPDLESVARFPGLNPLEVALSTGPTDAQILAAARRLYGNDESAQMGLSDSAPTEQSGRAAS